MSIDPTIVRQHMANLRLQFPELEGEEWIITLESETDLYELLNQLVKQRQETLATIRAIDEYLKKELLERKARLEHKVEGIEVTALRLMKDAGISTHRAPLATISASKGRMRLNIPDESAVPDAYCKIERKPDKAAIKDYLLFNQPNWASLEQGPPTLTVRTK